MINLIVLLFSLLIQFGAANVTPYNMATLNSENEHYIDEIKEKIANNAGGFWYNNYHVFLDVPNEQWIVLKGYYNNQYADKVIVCCPREAVGIGSSGVSASAYTTYSGENNLISSIQLYLANYSGFHTWDNGVDNDMSVYGQPWYNFESGNFSILYCDKPIYSGETLVVDVYNAIHITTGDAFGSLSGSGHSSGTSPLDALGGFSWSSSSGATMHSSGHSHGVSSSAANYDFSNATQNLLGQIVDNTNDLLFNGHSLGEEIKTINANIINGASAIFNGISQFNNNFINTYVYDEETVNDTIENSSMFAFANATTEMTETIINESDVLLDAVHDMEEKQDLVIYLDLTKWRVPVYSSSTGVNTSYVKPYDEVVQIDFSFLKETKSIWQPILLGVLYLSLFLSIYFDLPNILRGANA